MKSNEHLLISERGAKTGYAPFQPGFVWWALGLALAIGFAVGAHVAAVMALRKPPGPGFASFIQVHGHVQLIGWAGLLILGISLHFIPRLVSQPILHPERINHVLYLVVGGLTLRSLGHILLPYIPAGLWFRLISYSVMISGILEWLGILLYLTLLIQTFRISSGTRSRRALDGVMPFFLMMFSGWFIYSTINMILLIQMVLQKGIIVNQLWDSFLNKIFLGLVLLPVAFAFSLRTFPLYLRLPAPNWAVTKAALVYLVAWCLETIPAFPNLFKETSRWIEILITLGKFLKGGVILWIIWKLDVLTRCQEPWTGDRKLEPEPGRRPTRPGLPDYGEFGKFEWLIYAAYGWLALAAFLEIFVAVTSWAKLPLSINPDALRHIYLMGFITHLILGMAVRMIPGFLRKKRVASTKLVEATFWFGMLAATCRILPRLIPHVYLRSLPVLLTFAQTMFGLSGIFAMITVGCLTVNLMRTSRNFN
ncbi:MAG: hypothetical protein D6813_09735 [Calditrichaeota bacterium]|nr:MAG: hypothetical protein D6813_09735 [Calditrichota bacterium]